MRIALTAAALIAVASPLSGDEERKVICHNGWCAVREAMLRELIVTQQKLITNVQQLRNLCGWEDKP